MLPNANFFKLSLVSLSGLPLLSVALPFIFGNQSYSPAVDGAGVSRPSFIPPQLVERLFAIIYDYYHFFGHPPE